jgi:acetoin utilization deacetylase AcuC-like enzyme
MGRPRRASLLARLLTAGRRYLATTWPGRLPPGAPRFVFHRDYVGEQATGPYDLMRPYRILHYLREQALLHRGSLHRPRTASLKRLRLVHTRHYLESLERPDALEPILGFAVPPDLQDAFLAGSRMMVGGTIRATKLALRHGGVVANLGGGFHHAFVDRGHGFSCFNDVAIAVRSFRERGFTAPILVVDLDIHDGDGTRAIFAEDASVHTFSLHNRTLLEIPALADTCVALGPDVDDQQFLAALREHLPPVLDAVRPGLVYYLAGSDGHRRDRLGNWRLSHDGLVARDRTVLRMIGELAAPPPVVYLLAGGYGQHAWRHPAATFCWLVTGDPTIRPPLEVELPLDHWRKLQRLFARPDRAEGDLGADWALTEADLPGLGGAPGKLFLDAIPRHGLELVLEQSGLLDRLRAKGFRKLQVDSDLGDPVGHLLRVRAVVHGEVQPLIELKLRRDRAAAPPYEMLAVEWLLLQNAGGSFELSQPRLPGQDYPGLGLLRDISAMLVVMCERLALDGLIFRPAHFHMAEISRYAAVYWEPEAEARHEAVRAALAGLRLREMDAAVDEGRVVDADSGEAFAHAPAPMVVPVSQRLREGPELERYRERVAAVAAPRFRVTPPPTPGA